MDDRGAVSRRRLPLWARSASRGASPSGDARGVRRALTSSIPGADLIESSGGRFAVRWAEPVDSVGAGRRARRLPGALSPDGAWSTARRGLHGAGRSKGGPLARAVVVFRTAASSSRSCGRRAAREHGPPPSSFGSWVRIGAEHVFTGLDHVAFVVGLFLVVERSPRRLLVTVTSFTVAHSITLALAATRSSACRARPWRRPSRPASSRGRGVHARSRTSRVGGPGRGVPLAWCTAWVHGALDAIGLPQGASGWALAAFNVGVGSLSSSCSLVGAARRVGFAGVAAGAARGDGRVYALGGAGAYWFVDRAYLVLNR